MKVQVGTFLFYFLGFGLDFLLAALAAAVLPSGV